MCRATSSRPANLLVVAGLSLRMQGHHGVESGVPVGRRFIPACAGPPDTWLNRASGPPVYPCVCRATSTVYRFPFTRRGLSLRMQGHRGRGEGHADVEGFIPAYAGPPINSCQLLLLKPVYPCVCRATVANGQAFCSAPGLSLRMQGHPGKEWTHSNAFRFIPAYAGLPRERAI